MKHANQLFLSLIVISVLLIGCDSEPTNPDEVDPDIGENGPKPGEVTISISGDVEDEKTGTALFSGAGVGGNEHSWGIHIDDSDPGPHTYNFQLLFTDTDEEPIDQPEAGTYNIGNHVHTDDPDSPVFTGAYSDHEAGFLYFSLTEMCGGEYAHTGTLTIDSATEAVITGSFEFDAFYSNAEDCDEGIMTTTITIAGEFAAENPFAQ